MTKLAWSEIAPRVQAIGEFLVVAVCTLAFAGTGLSILAAMFGPHSAGTHDFVEYWASGQLLAQHTNPYDADALRKQELFAGFPAGAPTLIMGNPPSALLLVLPLGLVGPILGEWLWLLAQLIILVISVHSIRQLYSESKGSLHLLAFAFAPALACLLAGQIAVFLLLGLVLFLRWQVRRPFFAGAALWLCLLKPHLFVLFGVVLLVWILFTRSYRILAGVAFAMIASSAVATIINPHVWLQYRRMMAEQRIDRLELPCPSIALRQFLYPHNLWMQCLPVAIGCAWALFYFWNRRRRWDWTGSASILMLVSVMVAPYSWFMDQTVLIPAVLAGAYASGSRSMIAILALISAGIEIAALRGVPLYSPLYLWSAPAWLIWYLLATWKKTRPANSN
jgi:hypothetical protein